MELYYQKGDNEAAVKQYKALEKSLRTMLNIAPSAETTNLYKLIIGDDN